MTTAATALQFGLELLAVVVSGYFTVVVWRRRSSPAARPLLGVAALSTAGTVCHAAVVHGLWIDRWIVRIAPAAGNGRLWLVVVFVVVLFAGGSWFLFTLQYTGRGGRLLPIVAAGIGIYWLIVLTIAFGLQVPLDTNARSVSDGALILFLATYLMVGLMTVGGVLVLTTSLQRNAVRVGEALALATGAFLLGFTPIVANNAREPTTVPVMLATAAGLFVLGIVRYPVFDAPPAARIAGRDRLIEETDDPFVVVDFDDRVRDLNPAAEDAFDVAAQSVLGDPLDEVLPTPIDPEAVADAPEGVQLRTSSGTTLACSVDRITDDRERSFGLLLVFRDVTERRQRERRSRVLTRLLADVITERVQSVADDAARIAAEDGDTDDPPDPSTVGTSVRTRTTRLLDIVARTREIERGLGTDGSDSVTVVPTVREVIDALAAGADADVSVDVDGESLQAAVDRQVLESVVELLVTAAIDRDAASVRVVVRETDSAVEIQVVARDVDTESGRAVEVETARQAVEQFGGRLSVRESGQRETQSIVTLPGTERDLQGLGSMAFDTTPTVGRSPDLGGEDE